MSTKVAKVTKTSTKTVPAKAVSKNVPAKAEKVTTTKSPKSPKSPTKIGSIRLSEEDKISDTDNYILNPNTKKCVKRDTPLGKKLVKAEESGEEVPKTMTETERIVLVVQTIKDHLDLEDSAIKTSLKSITNELPRGFPIVWGGKQKPVKHVDHPKQPSNAYIFYTKAIRQSVVSANPDLSNTEVVSMMAKMWKDTSDEDRVEYSELAAADKVRYEAEMKVFEENHPDLARAKSSPGKPTKATAYHKFCEKNREILKKENPDMNGKLLTQLIAEKWEQAKGDEDELLKYQELADEANEGFEERVTEYHETDSPKKLSEAEQKKADDPEHYELNSKTGRYVRKDEPKATSPVAEKPVKAKAKAKTAAKPEPEPVAAVASKAKKAGKAPKTVAEGVSNDAVEKPSEVEDTDDDFLVEA